jgi:hypothetical protein
MDVTLTVTVARSGRVAIEPAVDAGSGVTGWSGTAGSG